MKQIHVSIARQTSPCLRDQGHDLLMGLALPSSIDKHLMGENECICSDGWDITELSCTETASQWTKASIW